jgi:inosose dehydratase
MSTIRVGNAPCSWGTLEFAGTQTGRIEYEQMLDELVEAGYTGSELGDWGFMPTEAAALAAAFRQRGLALTGAYVGVKLRDAKAVETGEQTAVRTATLLAATADRLQQEVRPFLVLADDAGTDPARVQNAGRVKPELMLSEDEWQRYAAGAERIAGAVQAASGLRTVFHHHCAGFVETPEEIALLMDRTSPDLLGLVFDTGHFAFGAGGCNLIHSALNRHADRIWYVHFKDYDPQIGRQAQQEGWDYFEAVRHGIFCELGNGCVDFPAVYEWLQQHGYAGYITVEQDVLPGMGQPKESAGRNRAYLRSMGLQD